MLCRNEIAAPPVQARAQLKLPLCHSRPVTCHAAQKHRFVLTLFEVQPRQGRACQAPHNRIVPQPQGRSRQPRLWKDPAIDVTQGLHTMDWTGKNRRHQGCKKN